MVFVNPRQIPRKSMFYPPDFTTLIFPPKGVTEQKSALEALARMLPASFRSFARLVAKGGISLWMKRDVGCAGIEFPTLHPMSSTPIHYGRIETAVFASASFARLRCGDLEHVHDRSGAPPVSLF